MTKKSRIFIGFLSVVLIPSLTLFGAGYKELTARLDSYLTRAHEYWGFEGTALVAVDGHVILSKGYGMANREMGIPNTPETKFYIGSITKQFTAAAILILNERGLLDLHAPISRYLDDFDAPWVDRVTIHELLTHTSGIPNYTDDPEMILRRTVPMPDSSLLDYIEKLSLEFEPGTKFSYSNSGYIILGAVIERVSGQSYEAFLHHEILKPAGMNNSGYGRREMAVPNRADGYTMAEGGQVANAPRIHFSILHTAGALYSTVEDMLKWDQALYSEKILSKESIRKMFTPYAGNYCYGWIVEKLFGKYRYYHGGFLDGFNTTFDRWIEDRICIVVFSNEDEAPVRKIARGLAAIIYDKPHVEPVLKTSVALPDSVRDEYIGAYRNGAGRYLFVTGDNGELYSNNPGGPRTLLKAAALDSLFYARDNTVSLIFDRTRTDSISGLTLSDEDFKSHFARIPDSTAPHNHMKTKAVVLDTLTLEEYVGVYRLESDFDAPDSVFTLTVTRRGNDLYAAAHNTAPIRLAASAKDRFFHRVTDFSMEFRRNSWGDIDGCVIYMGGSVVNGVKIE